MLKVYVTQEEKTDSGGVGIHFAECFFGGMGYFLWNLRLFLADTNQDIAPSLAVKYCI
jgi:hypothetical protein